MKKIFYLIFFIFIYFSTNINAKENKMIIELKNGKVEIELYTDAAPNHIKQITTLANNKEYDGVVFHRVIDGFMAQTGDVEFGNSNKPSYDINRAGTGGSNLPDLKAEFSNIPMKEVQYLWLDHPIQIVQTVNFLFAFNHHLISIEIILCLVKLPKEWNLLTKSKKALVQMDQLMNLIKL